MKLLNNILYMEVPDLVESYGVPERTVWNSMNRAREGRGRSWRNIPHPEDARWKLIEYRTIPASTIRKYGIPSEDDLRLAMEDSTREDAEARIRELWRSSMTSTDLAFYLRAGLTQTEAQGYTKSAAWMRLLDGPTGKSEVEALEIPGITTKQALLELSLILIQHDKPHGLHNIGSVQILRRKLSKWRKAAKDTEKQLATLVHKHRKVMGRRGNQAAAKVSTAVERLLTALYIGYHNDVKLNYEQVWATYNARAEQEKVFEDEESGEVIEMPVLSISTVKNILRKAEYTPMICQFRDGDEAYRKKYRPYVLRQAAGYALSMATSDGEVSPFTLHYQKGRAMKRPTAYLIFDTFSQAIIGFALGMQENTDLMREAFYDMLVTLDGMAPLEIQLDNFGKGMRSDFDQFIPATTLAKPNNPQEKPAESLISRFEQDILRTIEGNVGQNIATSRTLQSKRNPDKELVTYTFEEIEAIYRGAIHEWNQRVSKSRGKGKSRWENLMGNIHPDVMKVEPITIAQLFGIRKVVTINRGYIRITHQGATYDYIIPNYTDNLSRIPQSNRVRVRFLPNDPSQAWIYKMAREDEPTQDEFIDRIEIAEKPQIAKAERTEKDKEALTVMIKRGKAMDKRNQEMLNDLPNVDPGYSNAEVIMAQGYTHKHNMTVAQQVLEAETVPNTVEFTPQVDRRWQKRK